MGTPVPQTAVSKRTPEPKTRRRAFVRYRCERPPARRVFFVESYQKATVEIHDLSCGGIGLIFSASLAPGTLLFIDLMGMEVPVEFLAHVVHATARSDGQWTIGCRFDRPLSSDELGLALENVGRREEI
jgi:PilZ domain